MTGNWGFNESNQLKEIITNNGTLVDVIQCESFKKEFIKQDHTLINFLLKNSTELTKIALGLIKTESNNSQLICYSILISQTPVFLPSFSKNLQFLQVLNNYLFSNLIENNRITSTFTRIFQFYIHYTSGQFLNYFPNSNLLLNRLFELLHITPIILLIQYLTSQRELNILTFLNNNNLINLILQNINNNYKLSNNLIFLQNYIESSDPNSFSLKLIQNNEFLNKIFNIGLESNIEIISSLSFKIILNLCSLSDDIEEENNSPFLFVLDFIYLNLSLIINYILNQKPFLESKRKLIEIITGLILFKQEVPNNIYNLVEFLFNQMFLNPYHTFLHKSFLILFEAIESITHDIEILANNCNMRERIINVFNNKKNINASYWIYLISICDYLSLTNDNNWKNFINNIINPLNNITKLNYGGPLPKENIFESDNDSDEFILQNNSNEPLNIKGQIPNNSSFYDE